ncbi:hypothetical protein GCM10027282_15690 [Frigoribacterium salinisoli]
MPPKIATTIVTSAIRARLRRLKTERKCTGLLVVRRTETTGVLPGGSRTIIAPRHWECAAHGEVRGVPAATPDGEEWSSRARGAAEMGA